MDGTTGAAVLRKAARPPRRPTRWSLVSNAVDTFVALAATLMARWLALTGAGSEPDQSAGTTRPMATCEALGAKRRANWATDR